MGDTNALIHLNIKGDLTKPATVLIEKIAEATEAIFKPTQIRRVARARTDAKKIEIQSKIECAELAQRAMNRMLLEEVKKQRNIEKITKDAIPQLSDTAKPEKVEDDWLINFFDKSRLVSNVDMQKLWARVLAGEANKPGTFSKRTVNFMATLDKPEALLFTKLCGFNWNIDGMVPLVIDEKESIYTRQGINFSSLNHLNSIGLITFEGLAGYKKIQLLKTVVASYHDIVLLLHLRGDKDNELDVGNVLLTNIGLELAHVCKPKKVTGFYKYVMEKWNRDGVSLSCPYTTPSLTV